MRPVADLDAADIVDRCGRRRAPPDAEAGSFPPTCTAMSRGPRRARRRDADERSLDGRRIVLGVTGGIAAYKAVEVCRRLVDAGAHVIPVLTDDATRFVGELTFSALASEPVKRSLWSDAEPIPHTRLGQSADLIVVVPATARFLGTYAAGISDGLLTATVLATRAPVVVCPAMHTEMWEHPAVQENLATLRRRGVTVVAPGEGRLAGGDAGPGRLADPADIVAAVAAVLERRDRPQGQRPRGTRTRGRGTCEGRRVVVSAGGTREPIDPVRFISNRSSGKQGHALAQAAADRGAAVVLVTTTEEAGPAGATVVRVDTAASMEAAMLEQAAGADVVVMAAAVADFRPKAPSDDQAVQGRRAARDRARADARHPPGAGAAPASRARSWWASRPRRARMETGRGQAGGQGGRPHGGQRRVRPRGRLRPRHQRRDHPRPRRQPAGGGPGLEAPGGRRRPRRRSSHSFARG